MTTSVIGINLRKTTQYVEWANLSYQTASSKEWIQVPEGYKRLSGIVARAIMETNVCDLTFTGGKFSVCQAGEDYQPRRPPPGTRKDMDRVRSRVSFEVRNMEDVVFREHVAENKAPGKSPFPHIEVQFTYQGTPNSDNDSIPMAADASIPALTSEALEAKARDLPLTKWAETFSAKGVQRIKVEFRRSEAGKKAGNKRWVWPAMLQFMAGGSVWQATNPITITEPLLAFDLNRLSQDPVYGLQLEQMEGGYFRLLRLILSRST